MENKLNKLLLRQIKKHFGSTDNLPEVMEGIFQDINNTYNNFDDDTRLTQNSIEISSQELRDAYQKHKHDAETQRETINKIKNVIYVLTPYGKNDDNKIETFPPDSSNLFDSLFRLIEERKQADEEILKLSKAVEQNPVSILITDTKGNIEYVNPKFCELTGYTKQEVIGKNPRILKSGASSNEVYKDLWNTILSGNEWKGELQNRKKNGDLFWELAAISGVKNQDGEIVNFLAIKEDITERKQTEETLQNERALFRTIIDLIPNAVYVKDTEGRKIIANPEEVKLSGWSSEMEIIGKTDYDLYLPEEANRSADEDQLVLQEGKQVLNVEGRLIDKDGNLHSLLVSKVPLYDLQGKIVGLVGVTHDITERKKIEQELIKARENDEDSENRFKAIIQSQVEGIGFVNQNEVFEYANPASARIFETEADELIGTCLYDFLKPDGIEKISKETRNREEGIVNTYDLQIITKKGNLKYIHVTATPKLDSNNNYLGAYGVFQDITERKKAEDALRESEARLLQLAEQSGTIAWEVDAQGLFTYVSPVAWSVWGYSPDELIGKMYFYDLHPEAGREEFKTASLDMFALKLPFSNLVNVTQAKTGRKVWMSTNGIPLLKSDGTFRGYQGSDTDITERKQAEEKLKSYTDQIELTNIELDIALTKAEAAKAKANEMTEQAEMANKAKSIFLANMSHEIRTPLNAIIGFSQLMNRDPLLTSAQREYNVSIIRAGEHLLALINDILELSKVEAGRVELNPTNVDLYSLFNDIQMIFKERAQSKRLQFIFETASDLPRYVTVDDGKLRQIFVNLIGNAIKFTDEGGIAVRVRLDKTGEQSGNLVVEIQDSGSGISENELDKLFKHFVQTSSGIKKSSGTGLGLALSRELAIIMGGNITVTSEKGKGSVFTFNVKINEGKAEDVETNITKRVIHLDKGQEGYRVLVVDDKQENLQVVVNLLRLVGFETNEAVNGEDAIKKFGEWDPHLILMDMRMPVMDGYEATRYIKSTEKGKNTPIIALTASSFEEERIKTIALGMQGYICKPFRESELFGVIGKVLGIKFIYEEEKPHAQDKYLYDDMAITSDIEKLPVNLVLKMQHAVAIADFDLLVKLINSIDPDQSELGQHLLALANNFDYYSLQQILIQKETK